ncbi:MAG: PAS domain-containing protein [Candidatus Bathyarchaeota archaeon]|nr:PAS domain-containing protein [Candidatus Bathyarchaeota archaeon]
MSQNDKHHQEIVNGLFNQMKQILDESKQPIYIYLDDNHKMCNQQFATFLGYKSPQEWAKTPGFLDLYVDESSRETVAAAYWNAADSFNASTIEVTWKKKDGTTKTSKVIMVPMTFEGHILVVHFLTNVK